MTWIDQLLTAVPRAVADNAALLLAAATVIGVISMVAWLALTIGSNDNNGCDEQV